MTSETKKLISNLKKEIEKLKEKVKKEEKEKYDSFWDRFENWKVRLAEKQAQLQFAEKLIEAIKKDLIKKKPCPNEHPILSACYEQVTEEINKILNSALEKCQE